MRPSGTIERHGRATRLHPGIRRRGALRKAAQAAIKRDYLQFVHALIRAGVGMGTTHCKDIAPEHGTVEAMGNQAGHQIGVEEGPGDA